jgi:hypothetical protein
VSRGAENGILTEFVSIDDLFQWKSQQRLHWGCAGFDLEPYFRRRLYLLELLPYKTEKGWKLLYA